MNHVNRKSDVFRRAPLSKKKNIKIIIRRKKLHRKKERIYLGKFIKKVKVKNWQMEMLMMMITNTNTPRPNPDTCLVRLDGQILFES